jgi:hypothetical protein
MKYIKTNRKRKIEVYQLNGGSYITSITRTLYKSRITTAFYCKYKSVYHRVSISPRNEYFISTRIVV